MFDYEALDATTRERLALCERQVRPQMRRAAVEAVALGHSLAKVKGLLGHYAFGQWMLHEFLWGQDVTWRFLVAAQRFGVLPLTMESSYAVLSMLVAPTEAESACFEALVRRALGQAMTREVLRNIIIHRRARGLTIEDLAELTGIVIEPAEADDEDDEDDEDEEEDEDEANDQDPAVEGCSENGAQPGSRIAVRPRAD